MMPASPVLPSLFPDGPQEELFGGHQPQYDLLPAIKSADASGKITTRFSVPLAERFKILFSGSIWVQLLTFHNKVQPVKLLADEPTLENCMGGKSDGSETV